MKKLLAISAIVIATTCTTTALAADALPFQYAQMTTLKVTNPAALLGAMQRFRSSPPGMRNPTGVTLNQFIADGESEATHSIVVVYPNAAAIDASRSMNMGTAEWAAAGATFQAVSENVSSSLSALLKARIREGAVTSANPASMNFALAVSNPSAFMAAFDKLWNSSASDAFPGNSYLVNVLAGGESEITHAVVFQANDMATLLTGMEALQSSAEMAAYLKNANSFRSVVSRTVGVNVWSSPMPSN
jgi:putative intracellular protease/amidase